MDTKGIIFEKARWVLLMILLISLIIKFFPVPDSLDLIIGFIAMVTVICYIVLLIQGSLALSSCFYYYAYTKPSQETKTAVLTFDDGPCDNTLRILDILDRHGIKGTFFCIGKNIYGRESILREVDQRGHYLGNHSFSHASLFPLFFSKNIFNEIHKTNRLIHKMTGKTPLFFRPPFGVMSPPIARALKKTEMKVIGWNFRSFDTQKNQQRILKNVSRALKTGKSQVFLFHDTTETITDLLESLIKILKENQYNTIALPAAMNLKPYVES